MAATEAEGLDNNVELQQKQNADASQNDNQGEAEETKNQQLPSSRILGSGARRNGMDSGQLSMNKPESMAASALNLESRLNPIN